MNKELICINKRPLGIDKRLSNVGADVRYSRERGGSPHDATQSGGLSSPRRHGGAKMRPATFCPPSTEISYAYVA